MEPSDTGVGGDAATGFLADLFTFEVANAQAQCAGCGSVTPLGTLAAYDGPMGTVLRCPGCDAAMICVTLLRGTYRLDLRGTQILCVTAKAAAEQSPGL